MNLSTVITNLKRTIAGKETMLGVYKQNLNGSITTETSSLVLQATIQFLEINIGELKRILADVEQCVEKDVEQSWRDNPDRMGGQFSQDEIYDSNRSGWIEP